jgi:hypothetical protein
MSIEAHSNLNQANSAQNFQAQKQAKQNTAAQNANQFRNILAETYNAVIPSEEINKQRFKQKKQKLQEDAEIIEGENQEDSIYKTVQKIKKSLKTLAEQERNLLDI